MGNIIFKRGDYVEILINDQVTGLVRVESIDTGTCFGGERVNAGYVMVLIIDVSQPHLIVEDIDEGDIHSCNIIDLRHKKVKYKYLSMC